MYEELKASLLRWNVNTSERQKLQHTYLFLIMVTIVVAGITSLISAKTGHRLMYIALGAVIIFLANAVVWSLLNSSVLLRFPTKTTRRK